MDPNMPVNVPVDDPNADTEWNDILRKHGVIPEKPPSPTPMIQEALEQARELAHENRLEGKDLDELDELEDEEDDAFLDIYRQKRFAELATLQNASVYNQVYPVQKPDYAKEVTEASQNAWVFVLLTSSSGTNTESRVMIEVWREAAKKFGDVKFCQMQADLCIEGYPDKNTPTILVYRDGDIKRQIVTLMELNGVRTGMKDLEGLLVGLGAIKVGDSRLRRKEDEEDEDPAARPGKSIRQSARKAGDDDDSDWD
ncbi:phosducin family protein [Zymoseptoria brevis]|uniref:Phosducin family protein n=1 Tax=Zymoseptoria brevis TaxID=1047168 RepID=A0A0F4GQP5_9PEZI|nr:phosducin family protein [Zymoseptoria brevis]